MTAHNEELTTEIYTRSDYSVAFVPDEKITTIRYIRFGSMSSEVSAQSFVSTAEHYQTKNQGSTTRRNSPPPEGRDHTVPVNHCSVPNNRPVFVHSHSQMMANDWYSARPMTTRPHSAPDLTALNAKLAAGSLVGNGGNKKSFITALDVEPEMLHFRHLTALTVGQSEEIKARSCTWPKLLVGYQVCMFTSAGAAVVVCRRCHDFCYIIHSVVICLDACELVIRKENTCIMRKKKHSSECLYILSCCFTHLLCTHLIVSMYPVHRS